MSELGIPTAQVPSALVAGKYRLTELLGRGGMGSVWAGIHTTLGTRVAVKFIDAEYAESPEARSRFENEARAAAKLRSKHVVEVYDHGVDTDGRPFIVMEFLQGEPLDKRLDRVGRLPAKDTARIIVQVCRALNKAHAAGIVHRDLKPENVFLVWDDDDGADVAKVVDFGIAKFTDASMGSSSSTRTGSVLGTPYYMSPEQARGLRSVDYRSDLWSVAVIAYRCIVGSLPFEGEAVGDLLVKLCTAPIPVPSHLISDSPPGFDAWLQKALSRDPAQRFGSALELGDSLAAVCGLSVRGPYAAPDPHVDGSGSYSVYGSGPQPAYATGPNPAQQVTAIDPVSALASATGAPTSQTQPQIRKSSSGGLVAAGLAALIVLSIGGAVALKKFGSGSEAPAAAQAPAPMQPPAAAEPAPTPNAPSTPTPEIRSAEPAASASAPPKVAPVVPAAPAAVVKAHPPARAPEKPAPAKPPPPKPQKAGDIGF